MKAAEHRALSSHHVEAGVRDDAAPPDTDRQLVADIARRVHHARWHRPPRVLLVQAGTIPETSSGKVQGVRLAGLVQSGALRDRLVHAAGD